jgi:hypothetical protein
MNIILILCALIIWLFGGYAEPTLPWREGRGVPPETNGFQRLRDRYLIAQTTEGDDYHENKMAHRCRMGLLAVVCAPKSFDRRFVRRSGSIHSLSLKAEQK